MDQSFTAGQAASNTLEIVMIDLHADAKAIHDAKIRAAFNLTILEVVIIKRTVTIEAVREALPANAKKFLPNFSASDLDFYAPQCLDRAFVELAERAGVLPQHVDYFRAGFVGEKIDSPDVEHMLEYAEDQEEARKAFEAGQAASNP